MSWLNIVAQETDRNAKNPTKHVRVVLTQRQSPNHDEGTGDLRSDDPVN